MKINEFRSFLLTSVFLILLTVLYILSETVYVELSSYVRVIGGVLFFAFVLYAGIESMEERTSKRSFMKSGLSFICLILTLGICLYSLGG